MFRFFSSRTVGVSLIAGWLSFGAFAGAAEPGEQFETFSPDGAWSWFTDPRAVYHQGKIYAGWVSSSGAVQVGALDAKTGEVQTAMVLEKFQQDDHAHPALIFLPDGRLAVFYSQHSKGDVHLRITAKPDDITEWGEERSLGFAAADAKGTMHANPVQIGGDNHAIGLLWRGPDAMPWFSSSTDLGQTWNEPRPLLRRAVSGPENQTHLKTWSDGKGRVDLAFADVGAKGTPTNIYFLRYENGAFSKADGTRVGGMGELPFEATQCDRVYDGALASQAWVWDTAEDAGGNPVVAYTRILADGGHRYHFARWDGASWQDQELSQAEGAFPRKPTGERGGATHYSGGIVLDHANPFECYVSRPIKGMFEIERMTSADTGKTWRTEPLTAGSKQDNVRPVVVRDQPAGQSSVLWMNVESYTAVTKYRSAIKISLGATPAPATTAAPAAVPPVIASSETPALPPLSAELAPKAVLAAMERVADWQLAHLPAYRTTDWRAGAGWTGIMALTYLSINPKYHDAMMQMSESNNWQLGPRQYFADDQCVGQTYLELYFQHHEARMLEPTRQPFDAILAAPKDDNLEFKAKGSTDHWSWCDSLFMAPPVWARLWAATGETKYLDFMTANWRKTSDYLYDKEEHLFFRDSTYFDKRETNSKKVFWSRGNGWVMAGLARVLQYLPAQNPARPLFEQQFREMADKLIALQQTDGLWRSSLLDPESYPHLETSGSGFYCYAFAWGVNQGLLDRAKFAPAAEKAWRALVGCVAADGKLMHVQPVGADPKHFADDSTDLFGVGAFLLAGSEIYFLSATPHP